MTTKSKALIVDLLKIADVEIGGSRPWDMQVHNDRLYDRIIGRGTLGIGEAYMDGWWDCDAIDELVTRVLTNNLGAHLRIDIATITTIAHSWLLNRQRRHVDEVAKKHYDIGNELYEKMLDKRMVYSCGYWKTAKTLDEAQEAKLDLVCRKLGLEPGMRVLDIGSGWGGFLHFAAERYGIEGVGLTISKEQADYANAHRGDLSIETRLEDYMSMTGKFDRIVSIGMFEHVGAKNYRRYMKQARDLLKTEGLFLLHTIGSGLTQSHNDPWLDKYIFPNGMLPSPTQISKSAEGFFNIEDWHSFGAYYDPTLMAWHANFEAAWPELNATRPDKYDERFHRMWRFYLRVCAGMFRARSAHLWQIILSPESVPGGYESIR